MPLNRATRALILFTFIAALILVPTADARRGRAALRNKHEAPAAHASPAKQRRALETHTNIENKKRRFWWWGGSDSDDDPPVCPKNDYLNEFGQCIDCPTNARSAKGTEGIENCKCIRNHYMDTSTYTCVACGAGQTSPYGSTDVSACECDIDFYNDGGSCTACPANSQSQAGADSRDDCKCNSGTWQDGNHFSNFSCVLCPDHSYSPIDATSKEECYCDADRYMNAPLYTECIACPAGSTSQRGSTQLDECLCPANQYLDLNDNSCKSCPATSSSLEGAVTILECNCPANTFLNTTSGLCESCAAGFVSVAGSTDVSACNCGANQYIDGGSCFPCPANSQNYQGLPGIESCKCDNGLFFDADTNTCVSCPAGATSIVGSPNNKSCACPSGQYISQDFTTCVDCPAFSYTNLTQLAENGYAGAAAIQDCTCFTYRTLNATGHCELSCPTNAYIDDQQTDCHFCQEGTYLKNGLCEFCPAYATSPPGSDEITDCVCSGGTFWDPSLEICKPCGKGFFCPGNNSKIECNAALPTESSQCHIPLTTLTDFSDSIAQCSCWTQRA